MGSTDHFAQQQFGEANVPKGSITTEIGCPLNVCFSRKRTHRCAVLSNALGPTTDVSKRSKMIHYSITSSAMASK